MSGKIALLAVPCGTMALWATTLGTGRAAAATREFASRSLLAAADDASRFLAALPGFRAQPSTALLIGVGAVVALWLALDRWTR